MDEQAFSLRRGGFAGEGVCGGTGCCAAQDLEHSNCGNFRLCTVVQTDPLGQGNIPLIVYKAGSLTECTEPLPTVVCVCVRFNPVQFTVCETVTLNSIDVQGEQQ